MPGINYVTVFSFEEIQSNMFSRHCITDLYVQSRKYAGPFSYELKDNTWFILLYVEIRAEVSHMRMSMIMP